MCVCVFLQDFYQQQQRQQRVKPKPMQSFYYLFDLFPSALESVERVK